MLDLQSRPEIDVADLALEGIGVDRAHLPSDPEDARSALVAETIRVGLHHLYVANGSQPVHQLSLRNWVARKLDGAVPALFGETGDYRDILLEGSGGNLEFLGDVLALSHGYLVPAPQRAIQVAPTDYILASGRPTAELGDLGAHIELSLLGRRLVGVDQQRLERQGIRVRSASSFLDIPAHTAPPRDLLQEIMGRTPEEWRQQPASESYQGEATQKYDFPWAMREHPFAAGGGASLVFWRNRIGANYFEHWLVDMRDPQYAHRVHGSEWRRACLALDHLTGESRRVIVRDASVEANAALLELNFTPWAMFWRWMLLQGARSAGRKGTYRHWTIPANAANEGMDILRTVGLNVRDLRSRVTT